MILVLCIGMTAKADSVVDFTFTFTGVNRADDLGNIYLAEGLSASGTFVTTYSDLGTFYTITSLTGLLDGSPTVLDPSRFSAMNYGFGFLPYALFFSVDGAEFRVYDNDSPAGGLGGNILAELGPVPGVIGDEVIAQYPIDIDIELAPTVAAEPSSILLLIIGIGGLGLFCRYARSQIVSRDVADHDQLRRSSWALPYVVT
jgi:hypothetical protein